ncbi:hypothetical protein NO2_1402 [Candidatus Termititenax persephonae]|uniref:Uncharacterized protein n=1 Tax=Candidatus Termititenax persephonae TaxID=2218525 RepID=A0A388TJA2_9BACT|nr:hypothetical protein NO2_1402 [Candidatus Termititenax persephonae]
MSSNFDLSDTAALDEELFKPRGDKQAADGDGADEAAAAEEQPKIVLPQPTNTHAAITNTFQLDSRQEIERHKRQQQIHSRLKAKQGVFAKTVFGRVVDQHSPEQAKLAARDFYTLLRRGWRKEARNQFRLMTSGLQEAVAYSLLRESGLDLRPWRADWLALFKDAQLSAELKELAGVELSPGRENPLQELLAGVKNSTGSLGGYLDNLPRPAGKPDFVRWERALARKKNPELSAAYAAVRKYLLRTRGNVRENRAMLLNGQMGAREFAEYLDNTIIGLENVCFGFTENLPADLARLRAALQAAQAETYRYIADTLRDIYQQTPDNLVFKLSEDAYFLLNDALISLQETQLSVLFCDLGGVPLGTAENLAFLDGCYEYSSRYKPGTAVALTVAAQIFRLTARGLLGWDKGKLDELRRLAEFLERARDSLREFTKKLEDIKEIKRLDNVLVVLNTFLRGLRELEKILTAKFLLNKSAALHSSLAKYSLLLESDKWQGTIAAISDFSRGAA